MAKDSLVATGTAPSKSPYQLDLEQVTQACTVLLKNIADEKQRRAKASIKPNLLAASTSDSEHGDADGDEVPIWLISTTKRHVVDKKRLKPGKIVLPNALNTSESSTICIITADPQRTYKDLLDHPSFPAALRRRITRVIGFSKLKSKYKPFENRRQLFAEHDIFLADDRIVTFLPEVLGKVFYKGGSKRPIPIAIAEHAAKENSDGQELAAAKALAPKRNKEQGSRGPASPATVAREVERALGAALVHLAPSVTTAVKVANDSFTPGKVAQNVDAVVSGLIERYIPKGWRNVRAIHIKGPETMALPIWLASELWLDDEDIKETNTETEKKNGVKALKDASKRNGTGISQKRKAGEKGSGDKTDRHVKKKQRAEDEKVAETARKTAAKKQKSKALAQAVAEDDL